MVSKSWAVLGVTGSVAGGIVCPANNALAASVTIEYSPSSAGVVRAIAGADHCRCVSIPRWARASSNVTSICQRGMNQASICSGPAPRSGHRKACLWKVLHGSRTSTQRNGTTGKWRCTTQRCRWRIRWFYLPAHTIATASHRARTWCRKRAPP